MSDEIAEIKEIAEKIPHGPWGWFGGESQFYLATKHSGRQYIMGFVRLGMNGAQPMFRNGHTMVEAHKVAQFEVGDHSIVGFDAARKNGSVYRYDVRGFKNDVARWVELLNPTTVLKMVKAYEAHDALVSALEEMTDTYCDLANSGDAGFWDPEKTDGVKHARAALALAKGE